MAKVAAEVGSTANSYQILAKLAVGGMAEIFLARGASVAGVERYCVLKRILRERAANAQFAQMFLDEARLAAQLQHPNIAAVYDIGMLGDSYFFTMEYVHGETVRSLLQRALVAHRPIPLACALTIVAGAAAGLHHAHERNANDGRPLGIVHRDVSPSNLMVSYEGNVKVVDFGVAKAAGRAVETNSGTVKGKISYLSPEQCRGAQVDRRSDLFSLGIVMWELLTGARLYRRDSDFESMTAIVHEPPSRPSLRRGEVPRAVDDIVLRLLAKSVGDRFQTAAELVEAIEHASMRAGTILSTSAVARLVRDLFGGRAEPWLELERDTLPLEPLSFVSQPIPTQSAATPSDALDLGLARILDLSDSSAVVEIADEHRPALPAPRPVKVFGPAAVPTLVEAFVPAQPPPSPQAPPALQAPPSADSAPAAITVRASAPIAVPSAAAALAALSAAAGSPANQPWSSTLLGVGAPGQPVPSTPSALAVAAAAAQRISQAQAAAPGAQTRIDPAAASHVVTLVHPSRAKQTDEAARWRKIWTLIAVMVVAMPVGVVAALLSMPDDPVAPPESSPGPAWVVPSVVEAAPADPPSAIAPASDTPANPASPPASDTATNAVSPPEAPVKRRGPCDTMNVDELLRQAASQYSAGYAKASLAMVVKALACKQDPRMYRLAVMYACSARDLPTAKRYFAKVPRTNQSSLEQKCQLEGLNVRGP